VTVPVGEKKEDKREWGVEQEKGWEGKRL